MTAPNPLIINDVAQANAQADAQHNYNYNIEKEEDRGALPSPCKGKASAPLKKGNQGEPVVISPPQFQIPAPPESPISNEERASNVAKLDEVSRKLKGGSAR
jgi:hypothetical protein